MLINAMRHVFICLQIILWLNDPLLRDLLFVRCAIIIMIVVNSIRWIYVLLSFMNVF